MAEGKARSTSTPLKRYRPDGEASWCWRILVTSLILASRPINIVTIHIQPRKDEERSWASMLLLVDGEMSVKSNCALLTSSRT